MLAGATAGMIDVHDSTRELDTLDAQQMREMVVRLQDEVLHRQGLLPCRAGRSATSPRTCGAAAAAR